MTYRNAEHTLGSSSKYAFWALLQIAFIAIAASVAGQTKQNPYDAKAERVALYQCAKPTEAKKLDQVNGFTLWAEANGDEGRLVVTRAFRRCILDIPLSSLPDSFSGDVSKIELESSFSSDFKYGPFTKSVRGLVGKGPKEDEILGSLLDGVLVFAPVKLDILDSVRLVALVTTKAAWIAK